LGEVEDDEDDASTPVTGTGSSPYYYLSTADGAVDEPANNPPTPAIPLEVQLDDIHDERPDIEMDEVDADADETMEDGVPSLCQITTKGKFQNLRAKISWLEKDREEEV
jgi:hypothetical protein